MELFIKRAMDIFETCQRLLLEESIPISKNLAPLQINHRAKSRFGCCKKHPGTGEVFQIEISKVMESAADREIEEVLLHELLHTCPGCMNHGERWKGYANYLNEKYGYRIKTSSSYSEFGLEKPESREQIHYRIVCKSCGMEIERKRRSKLVKNVKRYRCGKCGGKLEIR